MVSTLLAAGDARAQSEGQWSTPAKLFENSGTIREPNLVADPTGAVHAFWLHESDGTPMAIFYARKQGDAWTSPVDIISMSGTLSGPRATIDKSGRLKLIWHGPGNTLFFSTAESASATTATGWSTPVSLVQANPHSDITVDDAGILHLVYPQLLEGGVNYIQSKDGGKNWSEPVHIADPVKDNATTEFARLSISTEGTMHIVWTELTLPQGYPPLGVFYSRSVDAGQTWSAPVELAGADYMEVDVLAAEGNLVYAAWNGRAGVSGRYYRWSQDAGQTWSGIGVLTLPELGGGSTNPPELEVDSSGTVHIILNTSPGNIAGNDATMYIQGRSGQWTPALDISQQAPGYVGWGNETSGFAIGLKSRLHVLFLDNNGTRLWYTWKVSSAPAAAPAVFLSASSTTSEESRQGSPALPRAPKTASAERPILSQSASNSAASPAASPPSAASAEMTLVISILPAVVVIMGTVLVSLSRRRTR